MPKHVCFVSTILDIKTRSHTVLALHLYFPGMVSLGPEPGKWRSHTPRQLRLRGRGVLRICGAVGTRRLFFFHPGTFLDLVHTCFSQDPPGVQRKCSSFLSWHCSSLLLGTRLFLQFPRAVSKSSPSPRWDKLQPTLRAT